MKTPVPICGDVCWSACKPDGGPVLCDRERGHETNWHWNRTLEIDWRSCVCKPGETCIVCLYEKETQDGEGS